MDAMDIETTEYVIPAEKLYGVVELVVDVPNEDGETDVKKYSCVAATNWLYNVKRIEDGDGHVKYIAGDCKWPKNESKLDSYLERRSKPAADWVSYPDTQVLKFCRSLGHAKEQMDKAVSLSALSESDTAGVPRKRLPVPPSRYGCDEDEDSDSERPALKTLKLNAAGKKGQVIRGQESSQQNTVASTSNAAAPSGSDSFPTRCNGPPENSGSESDTPPSHHKKSSKSLDPSSDESEKSSLHDNDCNLSESEDSADDLFGHSDNGKTASPDNLLSVSLSGGGKSVPSKSDNGLSVKGKKPADKSSRRSIDFSGIQVDPPVEERSQPASKDEQRNGSTPNGNSKTPSSKVNSRNKPSFSPRKKPSFSPRKLTPTMAPVSNFVFKREMEELRRTLNSLKVTVNKIYNSVCPITESVLDNEDDRGMPPIPVDSFPNLVRWEKFLQDHDNSVHVVRLLTERCLSSSLKDSVYGMLKFIVTNKIACAFNAKGKNKKNARVKKLSFQSTRSCAAMTAALKAYENQVKKMGSSLSYPVNALELVKSVGLWLKDAPKRYLIDLKAAKQVPESAEALPDELYPVPPEDLDLEFD